LARNSKKYFRFRRQTYGNLLCSKSIIYDSDVDSDFSLEKRASDDSINKKVQDWENLMYKYQKALPIAKKGEK
jgi:hypothetical protein